MRYLILVYSNPQSRAIWERLTDEQRIDFARSHFSLSDELAASGELIASEGLTDPSLGKGVSVRDGVTITSDGPYAEVKEYLAGFYLIECDTIEQAIEQAARVPDAQWGQVEVRPVFDRSGLDL